MVRIIWLLLALISLGFVTASCFANGGYKPTIDVAAPPAIPVQRALIRYRDGVETLIVESTFQTPSKEVVWILPLPAEPVSLAKGDSGLLETLSIQLQPKIITTSSIASTLILAMVLFAIPLALIRAVVQESLSVPAVIGIALMTWFICFGLLMPSFPRARASGGSGADTEPGVTILDSLRVGNFDSTVLRADSVNALADYLAQNNLQPLNGDEKRIFGQYIAEGWCFVLSQLHPDNAGGLATPHPICAAFPAKSPVFPMRATAMAGSQTHVELFVATDGHAAAPGFETIISQSMHARVTRESSLIDTTFVSNFGLPISHPDLKDILWNGCTVTKLTADLTPAQMDHDVAISLSAYRQPYRQSLNSTGVRDEWVTATACVVGTAILCWLSIAAKPSLPQDRHNRPRRIWGAIGLGTAICCGIIFFFPAVQTVKRPNWRSPQERTGQLTAAARQAIRSRNLDASLLQSQEKLVEILSPLVQEETLTNINTGKRITRRCSPGNYDVYERSGQVYLNLMPIMGPDYEIALPPHPADQP